MSIKSEITRLIDAKTALRNRLVSKGVVVPVISPSGSKSIAAGTSATVQSTVDGLIAVSMGRYYAYPQSGGTVVYTSGNTRNGQIFFIKVTAGACTVVTSTKAFM